MFKRHFYTAVVAGTLLLTMPVSQAFASGSSSTGSDPSSGVVSGTDPEPPSPHIVTLILTVLHLL